MVEINKNDIIEEFENGFSIYYIPSEKDTNVNGSVHGGVLFWLCDEAIGRYVTSKGLKGAAADSNIHFYRPAKINERLTATVSERKVGRKLGIYLVELRNAEGKLLADSLFTVVFA